MCGAADAFTPDLADKSKGYCSAEGKTWLLRRLEPPSIEIVEIVPAETSSFPPEGCKLVAHDTGDGWALMVESRKGETVAYLDWPKIWPEVMAAKDLRRIGFEVV
jgi:hypothetical protein